MLAEEDALCEKDLYTTTVTCKQVNSEVFCIKLDEFYRRFKANHESWKVLILMALAKERAIQSKLFKITGIHFSNTLDKPSENIVNSD